MTGLVADVALRVGALDLDVRLAVDPGEVVAVLGPNGAGKTTLLRAIAGLQPVERGRVVLDGEVLTDTDAGIDVPVEDRRIAFVFQDHLLFPHLDALDNVAFGLRSRGVARGEARERAAEWLGRVGLADRAQARPRELSGGQAQRVALARALAVEPRLLLLDEPLAALDASTRLGIRRDLRRHLVAHAGAHVVVTHDPIEAAALADRLVVVERGRVVQSGTSVEIAAAPRSRYVADLVGVNLLRGRAEGDHVALASGAVLVAPDAGSGEVFAAIHPRAVSLHRERPAGTPRNVWEGRADGCDVEGDRARVHVAGPVPIVAEVTLAAVDALDLRAGGGVWVAVKATEIRTYPV